MDTLFQILEKMKRRSDEMIRSKQMSLVHKIGCGMYGSVYEVKLNNSLLQNGDATTNSNGALKLLNEERDFDYYMPPHIKEILIGGSVCKLRKSVVTFIRGRKSYATFSEMGYCTLYDLARNKCVPLHAARIICLGILRELETIHQKGIIHRDLKPENIVILNNQWPPIIRIIDFGLSTAQKTSNETEVVSLWWRAPELLYKFDKHCNKIDIWSFGAILTSLVSKNMLTNSGDLEEAKESIWKKIGYPSSTLWEELHLKNGAKDYGELNGFNLLYPEAADVLSKALLANPKYRSSASDLLDNPFWFVTNEKDIAESKIWYAEKMKIVEAKKKNAFDLEGEIKVVYEEGKDFVFCYEGSNEESDALYAAKSLNAFTQSHALSAHSLANELKSEPIVLENAILIMDRIISGASNFPPFDQASILCASFFIAYCIYSDYIPRIEKLVKITKATSIQSVIEAVHNCLCNLRCRLIPENLKKYVKGSQKWEKIISKQ